MEWHRSQDHEPGCAPGRLVVFLTLTLLAPRGFAQTPPSLEEAGAWLAAGKPREAAAAFHRVAAANEDVAPTTAAKAYNNACVLLTDLGSYQKALEECSHALRLRRGLDDKTGLARTLNNLGRALRQLGRYTEAADRVREALRINRRRGDEEGVAVNLDVLGGIAFSTGDFSQALGFYAQALEVAEGNLEAPWALHQRTITRINRGALLLKLRAFREALAVYQDVLNDAGELEPWRRALLEVNVGIVHRHLGDPRRALAAFRQAITTYEEIGDPSGLCNAYLNLALVLHLNLGQPAAAEEAYREALRLAQAAGNLSEEIQGLFHLGRLLLETGRVQKARQAFERCRVLSEDSGSAEGLWSALEGLGRVAAAGGDLRQALAALDRAMDEIETVRASLGPASLRAQYFVDKRSVYQAAVRVLVSLEKEEPGAGYGEKAFLVVQRSKARVLLDDLGGAGGTWQPVAVRELRAQLGDGVLLELFLGERDLFAWVVTRGGLRTLDLGPAEPVLEAVAGIHRTLSQGQEPEAARVTPLAQRLLGELGGALEGSGRLLVAPDGRLNYLPFEILDHPDLPKAPLVDAVAVSYLPSASALVPLRHGERRPDSGRSLGFADHGRFPASTRELAAMERWLAGQHGVRAGEEATEKALREAVAAGAQVVHIASHTTEDKGLGRGAAILLTPTEEDDGLLYPEEIARLDYRVELTVLASCRTALGWEEEGRGLATLTGALLRAGSRAVVATLWDVEDETTAAFMEQFYYQLGRGHAPVEALHRTKQRLRSDPSWDRASLWAPYVLIGDAPALVKVPLVPVWTWAAVAVLVAFGLLRHWVKGRRRTLSR